MCEEALHPGEVQIVDVESFLQKTTRPSQEAAQANGANVAADTSEELEVVEDSVDTVGTAPSFDCGGKPAVHEEKD